MKPTYIFLILTTLLLFPASGVFSFEYDLAPRNDLSFDEESPLPSSSWMIALGGYEYDNVNAAVEWMGSLYFAGSKDDDGVGAPKAWFLATDLDGNLLLDRAWVDSATGGAEFMKLAVGDILYAAGIVGTPATGHDLFVMGLTADGDILWQVRLVDEGDEILGDMILTSDGSLLLVGVNRAPGEYVGEGWVVKMDTSGNIVWQKSYGTVGVDYLRVAMNRSGGGYVVAGEIAIEGSNDFFQGWIMALDDAGAVIWQKAYLISNSDGINALINAGNRIIGLGSALQLAFYRGDAWILQVDSGGNVVSSDLIGDFDTLQHDEFVDAVVTRGGNLIALGNTVSITGGVSEQVWAARITREGQLKGLRHYGGGNVDTASDLLSLGADGFAFAGWTQWSPRIFDGYLVKVDKQGDGFTDCDRVNNLNSELRPVGPVVSEPTLSVEPTYARVVEANLTEEISDTYSDFLCAD
jgi:hypothetical protein